jgi:aminopeptidase N
MAHDPDPFTRWEAGQAVARAIVIDGDQTASAELARALARELDRAQEDPAFAALALRLPDLGELILAARTPDPDALHAAREALRGAIATTLRGRLSLLAAAPSETPFSPDAQAAGHRALKGAALDLLSALGPEMGELLERAFAEAGNMTDAMAGLDALGQSGSARFEDGLARFYARWKDNPLVIDKWFAVQAACPRDDALARVQRLRAHADFTIGNPNRVRALAAAFSMRNPRAFHAADGGGYRFVAALAGEIDARNPALAARLLTAFESWRRFDSGRQEQAYAALAGLAETAGLSKNAREVVERTLG